MKDAAHEQQISQDGYSLLQGAFSPEQADGLRQRFEQALARPQETDSSIRSQEGTVSAARNVLTLWPEAGWFWQRSRLAVVLEEVLGRDYGLVRVLFFDKPPGQTWALPWHKDLTIAVVNNRLPSPHFARPTRKAGVPHIEAPQAVLEGMLTARLHLDDATPANGPLQVIPGSHRTGKELTLDLAPPKTIYAARGDVLLMRPLVAHCSGKSLPDCTSHRRVLHLEFSSSKDLPDGYAWQTFIPGSGEELPAVA
jgi:ectoine hydroxylase-related dioxygenase (phytanoyl-CoA dioxygenase family)